MKKHSISIRATDSAILLTMASDTNNWKVCTINYLDMEVNSFEYQFGDFEHHIIVYRMPNRTGQLSAFTNDAKKYIFIITNDLSVSAKKAIVFYNVSYSKKKF